MPQNVLIIIWSAVLAVVAVAMGVVGLDSPALAALAFVVFIGSAALAAYLQTQVFGPLRQALSLLGGHEGKLSMPRLLSLTQSTVQEHTALRLRAQELEKTLEESTRRAQEILEQSKEASRLAEQSKEEGMREAAERLESMVEKITQATDHLAGLTDQVITGADNQKNRMHEISVAMDEMNRAIAEVSGGAAEAAVSGSNAKEHVQVSLDVVTRSREAIGKVNDVAEQLKADMTELGERAGSIDQVINVITDIADQTNLLALNAAIEAARAGEAGRGFAVVADEVRKLAEKTMVATKEVGATIRAIQEAVHKNVSGMDEVATTAQEASSLSEKSGESARMILSHAEDNASKIANIAAAAEEQSASSTEINRSVEEVREIAVSIADGIHDSSKAIDGLTEMAIQLSDLIQDMKANQSDTLVSWSHGLSVNIREIDEQHKKLVQLLNDLYAAMKAGKGEAVQARLLEELVNYTIHHFENEERYLTKYGYPEFRQHKQEHEALKAKVADFAGKLRQGKVAVSSEILTFLKNWVVNHIKKTDKRYSSFLNQKGLR